MSPREHENVNDARNNASLDGIKKIVHGPVAFVSNVFST